MTRVRKHYTECEQFEVKCKSGITFQARIWLDQFDGSVYVTNMDNNEVIVKPIGICAPFGKLVCSLYDYAMEH